MEETIFSKIIRREIPADIVYEDAHTLAFLDTTPVTSGHAIVVPKKFARNLFDADDEILGSVMHTVQKISWALRGTLGAEGVNIHINNEPVAGQIVFHFHIHVIPRYTGDGLQHWHGKPAEPAESAEIAEKIRQALK